MRAECQECDFLDIATVYYDLKHLDHIWKSGLSSSITTLILAEVIGNASNLKHLLNHKVRAPNQNLLLEACNAKAVAVAEYILTLGIEPTLAAFEAACSECEITIAGVWKVQRFDQELQCRNGVRLVEVFLDRRMASIDTALVVACRPMCIPGVFQRIAQAAIEAGSKQLSKALTQAIERIASDCVDVLLNLGIKPVSDHLRLMYETSGCLLQDSTRIHLLECCDPVLLDIGLFQSMMRRALGHPSAKAGLLPDFTAYVRRSGNITSDMFGQLCRLGDVHILQLAIERGAEPESNAMTVAASTAPFRHADVMRFLHSIGIAMPNQIVSLVCFPRNAVIETDSVAAKLVQDLIECGAEITVDDVAHAIENTEYLVIPRALWNASDVSEDALKIRVDELKKESRFTYWIAVRFEKSRLERAIQDTRTAV